MDKQEFQTELVKALEHTALQVFGVSPEVIDLEIGVFDKAMTVKDRNVAGSYYGITVKFDPDKITDAAELRVLLEQALIFWQLQPVETAMTAHRKLYGRVDSVEAAIVQEKWNAVHRIQRMLEGDRRFRAEVPLRDGLGDDVVNFERVTAAALISPTPAAAKALEEAGITVPETPPEPVSLLENNGAVIPASEHSEAAEASVEPRMTMDEFEADKDRPRERGDTITTGPAIVQKPADLWVEKKAKKKK